jgi:hypothetical protein
MSMGNEEKAKKWIGRVVKTNAKVEQENVDFSAYMDVRIGDMVDEVMPELAVEHLKKGTYVIGLFAVEESGLAVLFYPSAHAFLSCRGVNYCALFAIIRHARSAPEVRRAAQVG